MWDPNHPNKKEGVGQDENDLVDFYDDQDFKDVLGT
jgi:hypothetical protein